MPTTSDRKVLILSRRGNPDDKSRTNGDDPADNGELLRDKVRDNPDTLKDPGSSNGLLVSGEFDGPQRAKLMMHYHL